MDPIRRQQRDEEAQRCRRETATSPSRFLSVRLSEMHDSSDLDRMAKPSPLPSGPIGIMNHLDGDRPTASNSREFHGSHRERKGRDFPKSRKVSRNSRSLLDGLMPRQHDTDMVTISRRNMPPIKDDQSHRPLGRAQDHDGKDSERRHAKNESSGNKKTPTARPFCYVNETRKDNRRGNSPRRVTLPPCKQGRREKLVFVILK